MKFPALLLSASICINAGAQDVIITPNLFSIDALVTRYVGMRFNCDTEGRFQGDFIFYSFNSSKDTVILFRTMMYNGCIMDTARWYNGRDVIREVITAPGSCEVHANQTKLMMPSNILMTFAVLMRRSTWWNAENPAVKQREDFYREGDLEKRMRYYPDGTLKSEHHYKVGYRPNDLDDSYEEWKFVSGYCIEYYPNGNKKAEGMREGYDKTGTWKYYIPSGQPANETTNHTKDSATHKSYYPSGLLKETYTKYKHNIVGDYRSFYETGEPETYTRFNKTGIQDTARISYYRNGQIESVWPCCGWDASGTYRSWHENGARHEEVKLTGGKYTGMYMAWHNNGKVMTKGWYNEEGDRDGKWYFYKESGEQDSTYDYTNSSPEMVYDSAEEIGWEQELLYESDYTIFTMTLPEIPFIDNRTTTRISIDKKHSLKILSKYDEVRVQVSVDINGNAAYAIYGMRDKHVDVLKTWFISQYSFINKRLLLMGEAVPYRFSFLIAAADTGN